MSPQHWLAATFTAKTLRARYIVALALIALLTIAAQWLVQGTLADQAHDGRVVNLAGRQRMLSQRITKAALILQSAEDPARRLLARRELDAALTLWRQSHDGLRQGDARLGLPGAPTPAIAAQFDQIEPHYLAMVAAAEELLIRADDRAIAATPVATILQHEPAFLAGMDEIVFAYDAEARHKVEHARLLELSLAAMTLITLVAEAIFIFAPAARRMREDLRRHEMHEADLEDLFAANPTAMFLIDAETMAIVRGNRRTDVLMGCSEADYVGRPLQQLLDQRIPANASSLDLLREGKALSEEEVVIADGRSNSITALASTCQIHFDGRRCIVLGVTNITAVKKTQQTLEYYATIDEMTGLVNRRAGLLMLGNAMNQARREQQPLSACYVDLDGLKSINDRHGHTEGDRLIRALAAALLASKREGDVAVRLGGDEFLLILHECRPEHWIAIERRVRSRLTDATADSPLSGTPSASFGFAHFEPARHMLPEDLIAEADLRMYEAKRARREPGILRRVS